MGSVERLARKSPPLVATVGALAVEPGAANVIPGGARLSIDVRHPLDRERRRALARILGDARRIARRRGLAFVWKPTQENAAVRCSAPLGAILRRSVVSVQGGCPALVSGAGHDAVILSAIAPVAMLFVRCRKGLSHHPDEYAAPRDVRAALEAMVGFLLRLAQRS